MKIGFLGLGNMGSAMARLLLAAGHEVTVWNRDGAKAEPLAGEGAIVAGTPAEAAQDAEILFTMLFDDAAHEQVLLGEGGALQALSAGSLHIACGTISVALSVRIAQEHASCGQDYVAAPVFGRPNVAAEGRLWIVVAGAAAAIAKARPVLEPLSRGISVVGERPPQAHAVKLAGNFMINMMIQSLSEIVVFAKASGIDPAELLEIVNTALFQSAIYANYSKLMLNPVSPPGAPLALGEKDLKLFLEAAHGNGVHLALAEQLAERYAEAAAAGLQNSDWAAGLLAAAESAAHR